MHNCGRTRTGDLTRSNGALRPSPTYPRANADRQPSRNFGRASSPSRNRPQQITDVAAIIGSRQNCRSVCPATRLAIGHYARRADGTGTADALTFAKKVAFGVGTVAMAAAIVFVAVGLFVFDRYHPGTRAMEPTVHAGDWIWTRPSGALTRGEIVLLIPPPTPETTVPGFPRPSLVIARIVAVGGETVDATGGKLHVNGAALREPYLALGTTTADIPKTLVPDDSVYVMDDNRQNSQGSRVYGPVPASNVKQRVAWIGAPSMGLVVGVTIVLAGFYLVALDNVIRTRRREVATADRSRGSRRPIGDVVWSALSLAASAAAIVAVPVLRPLSLVLLPFAAGYVTGWFRQPRSVVVSAAVAGAVFAAVFAAAAWTNEGCSGECNDTTANARLRVLVALIAAAVLVVAWSLGAMAGRRASRMSAPSRT